MIRKTRCSQEPVIAHLVFNFTSKFHSTISADSFLFCHLKFLLIVMAAILDQRSFLTFNKILIKKSLSTKLPMEERRR